MESILNDISASFTQMMGWELVAVILALLYLVLIMRENIWSWHCALISTAISVVIFWKVSLLMESTLNIYYMAMAVYGWWCWKSGGPKSSPLPIQSWSIKTHSLVIALIVIITLFSGFILSSYTEAAWPYLDSFTTWASVITTYLVAKKVLENWLYWLVINSVALGLYIERDLYLYSLLLILYLVISVFGYLNWKKTYHAQSAPESVA